MSPKKNRREKLSVLSENNCLWNIQYWMCYSWSWRPVIHLSHPAKNQVELSLSFWGSKRLFADEEQYHRTYMTDASLRTLRTNFDVFHDFFIISNLMGWMVKISSKHKTKFFKKVKFFALMKFSWDHVNKFEIMLKFEKDNSVECLPGRKNRVAKFTLCQK